MKVSFHSSDTNRSCFGGVSNTDCERESQLARTNIMYKKQEIVRDIVNEEKHNAERC